MTSNVTFEASLCCARPTLTADSAGRFVNTGLLVDSDVSPRQALNAAIAFAVALPLEMRAELFQQLQEELS